VTGSDAPGEPTIDVDAPGGIEDATSSMPESARSLRRAAGAPPERYVPGSIVAHRYRVSGPLGRGGMGEVYRADDLKLGQPVALKFLPAELAEDPERLALLLDEVRNARRVAHPNVCRVYDVGEAGGHHFISMEYVDGEDLAALLFRIGRLPRDKARRSSPGRSAPGSRRRTTRASSTATSSRPTSWSTAADAPRSTCVSPSSAAWRMNTTGACWTTRR